MLHVNNSSTVPLSCLPSLFPCTILSSNLGVEEPLQHTWDNGGRNNPCICFSLQEAARFVYLSCTLGLFAECLKTFKRDLPHLKQP